MKVKEEEEGEGEGSERRKEKWSERRRGEERIIQLDEECIRGKGVI